MLSAIQDIDLKLLRVFRCVSKHRGLAAAQLELNSSLSTISLQMKQLEERLGVRLCERGQAGFQLTPAGQAVLAASERLFASIDEFKNDVAESSLQPFGEIRLGIIDNLATHPACRVGHAIAELKAKLAGVTVNFVIAPPAELESQVINGTLHMAIGIFPNRSPALSYTAIFTEQHELYCGDQHPLFKRQEVTVSDVQSSDYVSWDYLESFVEKRGNLRFHEASRTPFVEGLVYLILSGRYVAFLPTHVARRWTANGSMRALLPEKFKRSVTVLLTTRKRSRLKRPVKLFYEELERAHGK